MTKTALAPSERELQHLQQMGEFMRVVMATHRLEGMRGQANAMLIGSPGYGKTQMLLRLEGNGATVTLSDSTYLGFVKMLDKAKKGYLSTVICPDFGPVLARDLPQVRKIVSICSMAVEEGVKNLVVGKLEKNFEGARFGLLTALTHDDIAGHYQILKGSGFLSRFILLEVGLTEEAVISAAQKSREGDNSLVSPLRMPETRRAKIEIPERYSRDAEKMWRQLMKERDDRAAGFRGLHLYQSLLGGVTYLRQPKVLKTTADDVDRLAWYHREFMLTQLKFDSGA